MNDEEVFLITTFYESTSEEKMKKQVCSRTHGLEIAI